MRRIAAAAVTLAVLGLAGCGGGSPAAQKECKVAVLINKDMGGGAVNGDAMGTYASALAEADAQGQLAGPAQNAVRDARRASMDIQESNPAAYERDAGDLIADLEVIHGDCGGK